MFLSALIALMHVGMIMEERLPALERQPTPVLCVLGEGRLGDLDASPWTRGALREGSRGNAGRPARRRDFHCQNRWKLGGRLFEWLKARSRGAPRLAYGGSNKKIHVRVALGKDAPLGQPVQSVGRIVSAPILGGLHYRRIRMA